MGQTFFELLSPSGLVEGDHGGPVQRFAQKGMAHFGESGLGFHAGPGCVLAGIAAAERRSLPAVGKAAGIGEEGQRVAQMKRVASSPDVTRTLLGYLATWLDSLTTTGNKLSWPNYDAPYQEDLV